MKDQEKKKKKKKQQQKKILFVFIEYEKKTPGRWLLKLEFKSLVHHLMELFLAVDWVENQWYHWSSVNESEMNEKQVLSVEVIAQWVINLT